MRPDLRRVRRELSENWEITSREDLLQALRGLAMTGYRAQVAERFGLSPLAWDVALYVDVVRKSFAAGYVDEHGSWGLLRNVVPPTRRAYGSWRAYADDYLLGRIVWMGTLKGTPDEAFPAPQKVPDEHIQRLLDTTNPQSPWNLVRWKAIDEPDRHR
jgi:hypothetical protein